MQGYIDVIVKDDKIEVMGQEFLLGELTVSLLNTDDKVLKEMGRHLVNLERLAEISRDICACKDIPCFHGYNHSRAEKVRYPPSFSSIFDAAV